MVRKIFDWVVFGVISLSTLGGLLHFENTTTGIVATVMGIVGWVSFGLLAFYTEKETKKQEKLENQT